MPNIEIYTTVTCPFCGRAKGLLDIKGVEYTNHNVTGNQPERDKMRERAGGKNSVPQIFIDGKLIGGCDDLYALEDKGELDTLLGL